MKLEKKKLFFELEFLIDIFDFLLTCHFLFFDLVFQAHISQWIASEYLDKNYYKVHF